MNIVLFRNSDEQVDFEIYSLGQESLAEEIVHCQGRAVFYQQPVHAKLDIEKLKTQMRQGRVAAESEEIDAIYRRDNQLLAELHLPAAVEASLNDYVLHPSLMDSVLQAAVGLMDGSSRRPRHPSLPFALESIRIESTCTKQMFAWVRYAQGSRAEDNAIRLDMDLYDRQGNVCVQMRGLAYDQVSLSDVASESTALPVTLQQVSAVTLERSSIALIDPQSQTFTQEAAKKTGDLAAVVDLTT